LQLLANVHLELPLVPPLGRADGNISCKLFHRVWALIGGEGRSGGRLREESRPLWYTRCCEFGFGDGLEEVPRQQAARREAVHLRSATAVAMAKD
jgi:hypothetical protein